MQAQYSNRNATFFLFEESDDQNHVRLAEESNRILQGYEPERQCQDRYIHG